MAAYEYDLHIEVADRFDGYFSTWEIFQCIEPSFDSAVDEDGWFAPFTFPLQHPSHGAIGSVTVN
jgi:hypothetical protein